MKILVVDDSKVMRMIVRRALAGTSGYHDATVVEAADGAEGLAQVDAESPDVILTDWNMPGMSGIEFLEALGRRPSHPPLGFVTSESTPQMHERATSAGASFLVTKPFTPTTLACALDRVL